jgi:hypothetical protein
MPADKSTPAVHAPFEGEQEGFKRPCAVVLVTRKSGLTAAVTLQAEGVAPTCQVRHLRAQQGRHETGPASQVHATLPKLWPGVLAGGLQQQLPARRHSQRVQASGMVPG